MRWLGTSQKFVGRVAELELLLAKLAEAVQARSMFESAKALALQLQNDAMINSIEQKIANDC